MTDVFRVLITFYVTTRVFYMLLLY